MQEKQQEKQPKKISPRVSKRAAGWVSGILSQIFAMVMAGALILTSSKYIMYHDYYGAFFSSPFEKADNFYDTSTFQNLFHRDMTELGFYLSCCAQLETDGDYDETKLVDVFEYQSIREELYPEVQAVQDLPELTYRIGDLIEWNEFGFSYSTHVVENTGEVYEVYGEEAGEYVLEEEAGEYADGYVDDATGAHMQTKVGEIYKPVNVDSIFDLELPEGLTYYDVAKTVQAAASNLSYNYYAYLKYRLQFGTDKNLKYMFVNRDDQIAYTNLDNHKNLTTDELKTAFMGSDIYLVYDYAGKGQEQKGFESAGIQDSMIIAYKTVLLDRLYNFPEGGTLYVALQTETSDAFGAMNENDFYALAAKMYSPDAASWRQMTPVMVASGILALITLLLFIIFQPKRKREELRYFDKWFTEFAAFFAFGSAFAVGMIGIAITKMLFIDIAGLTLDQRSSFYIAGALTTFSLLYLMLLYYMGSLVRRIKAGTFWKGSFCYYILHNTKTICKKIMDWGGKVFGLILNNKSLLIRTFGPYGLFLFLNLAFFIVFGAFGLLLDVILDTMVGVYLYYSNKAREEIVNGISRICDGEVDYQIKTDKLYGENRVIAEAVNQIGQAVKNAVQISMKDERLKADLITNVSHDIKTPLTSIINYVDLLKRENIQGEKAQEYIRILDEKSQRLKQLTLDLVEASKISSGNITLEMEELDVTELMKQALGEYEDRLEEKKLNVVCNYPPTGDKAVIYADSRRMWRILENLFGNICKYAMEGTRVYVDISKAESDVEIILRNISAQPLNIPADELTQRFIRGDISRSTEGSGLGLSIAQNLTTAQNGKFEIYLDGDLFKVSLRFPLHQEKA